MVTLRGAVSGVALRSRPLEASVSWMVRSRVKVGPLRAPAEKLKPVTE